MPRGRKNNMSGKQGQSVVNDESDSLNDLHEIKKSLNEITLTLDEVKTDVIENKESVRKLLSIIDELRLKIADKDRRIQNLENQLNDLEQYSKKNNIIVSADSKKLNLHSYRNVVRHGDAQTENENGNKEDEISTDEESIIKENFVKFCQSKLAITMEGNEILAIHKLRKRRDGIEPVLVKFNNNAAKVQIMKARKKLKGTEIYINDHLTQRNAELEKKARMLKRSKRINSTWSWNGKIYIKVTEEDSKKEVKNMQELTRIIED